MVSVLGIEEATIKNTCGRTVGMCGRTVGMCGQPENIEFATTVSKGNRTVGLESRV